MGCGCKNNEKLFSGETENSLTIKKQIKKFLFSTDQFSIGGLILFLVLFPVTIIIINTIGTIAFFNRVVLGKNTDIIKLMSFTKKKPKKIKE